MGSSGINARVHGDIVTGDSTNSMTKGLLLLALASILAPLLTAEQRELKASSSLGSIEGHASTVNEILPRVVRELARDVNKKKKTGKSKKSTGKSKKKKINRKRKNTKKHNKNRNMKNRNKNKDKIEKNKSKKGKNQKKKRRMSKKKSSSNPKRNSKKGKSKKKNKSKKSDNNKKTNSGKKSKNRKNKKKNNKQNGANCEVSLDVANERAFYATHKGRTILRQTQRCGVRDNNTRQKLEKAGNFEWHRQMLQELINSDSICNFTGTNYTDKSMTDDLSMLNGCQELVTRSCTLLTNKEEEERQYCHDEAERYRTKFKAPPGVCSNTSIFQNIKDDLISRNCYDFVNALDIKTRKIFLLCKKDFKKCKDARYNVASYLYYCRPVCHNITTTTAVNTATTTPTITTDCKADEYPCCCSCPVANNVMFRSLRCECEPPMQKCCCKDLIHHDGSTWSKKPTPVTALFNITATKPTVPTNTTNIISTATTNTNNNTSTATTTITTNSITTITTTVTTTATTPTTTRTTTTTTTTTTATTTTTTTTTT